MMLKVKRLVMPGILLFVVLLAALAAVGGVQAVDRVPQPHQLIDEYTGTETCLSCHPDASTEIMATTH